MPTTTNDRPDINALHALLDSVADTHEIVVRDARYADDALHGAWASAREDARDAWAAWSAEPGPVRWAVYVAARDREDAAVAACAHEHATV
ncbi:MAG: hypothetical protein M0P31_14960 [Solirubrobacteraceae bacterium]|nr:hypothetical protein [Solirubrobacteraceae bacterium]